MQITIAQPEIETAIKQYLGRQLVVAKGVKMKIEMRATRGDIGFSAIIDVIPGPEMEAETAAPSTSAATQPNEIPAQPASRPFPRAAVMASRSEERVSQEEEHVHETEQATTSGEAAHTETSESSEPEKEKEPEFAGGNGTKEPGPTPTPAPAPSGGHRNLFKGMTKPKN